MDKVTKAPITDITKLRVGQMITQDYEKPTQRALTVIEKMPGAVWVEARTITAEMPLKEFMVAQADLDAGTYDLKTVPRRRDI